MTQLINSSLYFHTNRHFVLTFCPQISKKNSVFIPFPFPYYFWTEGALRVAKAMTEVWKPGTISNIVAVPHVCQIENFEWLIINALPTVFLYFRYTQQLENWPGSA